MNLGFSQEINGKPSLFIEKIWTSIIRNKIDGIGSVQYDAYAELYKSQFGKSWDGFMEEVEPKQHTIRSGKRWKAGDLIYFVVNTNFSTYFRFAPVLKCQSVQDIEIKYTGQEKIPIVLIDGTEIQLLENYQSIVEQLVMNDGFDCTDSFITYFNADFTGQLVHWTGLKY